MIDDIRPRVVLVNVSGVQQRIMPTMLQMVGYLLIPRAGFAIRDRAFLLDADGLGAIKGVDASTADRVARHKFEVVKAVDLNDGSRIIDYLRGGMRPAIAYALVTGKRVTVPAVGKQPLPVSKNLLGPESQLARELRESRESRKARSKHGIASIHPPKPKRKKRRGRKK